ncbi:MAG: flagellar biosynthetic protein FliR [Xylanivirga thermophila]|jgi:flagellar biosynthesis protein FliR|uniref:flagellar biosynthetic protein FliR n=1 Tax=Xylanivirga thermophila TaxID=2496273 RepID=UPI00101D7E8E|nr:flagellar biosynthetic protein FliR [Xylanivirga thermophila]
MDFVDGLFTRFDLFLLVFSRITGMFLMSPIFSRKNIPFYLKIGFSVILSLAITTYESMDMIIQLDSFFKILYYSTKELVIGFAMGYVTTLFFSAILTGGQLIDTQIGFGIVNVLDPQNNIQVPLLGNFNNILALLLFFVVDGHHTLIKLLVDSFEVLPPGRISITADIFWQIFAMFKTYFIFALKLALPVVGAALLTEVALGIMVRTIPQMNVFVIGIPIKILVGLIALFLFIPVYIGMLNGEFSNMFHDIKTIIGGMAPK